MGPIARRGVTLGLGLWLSLAGASCKRGGGSIPIDPAAKVDAGSFDKVALLRAFGECAFSTYREAETAIVALAPEASKAATDKTPEAIARAREALARAVDAWQIAEMMQFGPAAMTGAPGGEDLRDGVYAWPLVNRCLIEQQMVSQVYDKPELSTALVSTRSLASLDYLLHYEPIDNGCAAEASINAQGTWAALGADVIRARRLAYAAAVSRDVGPRASKLVEAWDPSRGNFVSKLADAGKPGSPFVSQQMAFNAVSDALFYLDDQVKDMKVGKPAGIIACSSTVCPEPPESPFSGRALPQLRKNLDGFERIFRGCGAGGEGLGFDDLLVAVGASSIVQKVEAGVAASRAAIDALGARTFAQAVAQDPAGVRRLFDALKQLTDVLKTEFVTVLDLELPKKVEGDND